MKVLVFGLLLLAMIIFWTGILTPINDLYTIPLSLVILITSIIYLVRRSKGSLKS